ncbi:MAG: glycosyltransferase [Planctomycetota bacterium]
MSVPPLALVFLSLSALAVLVWAWINFGGGYGRSTHHQLPQPPPEPPPGTAATSEANELSGALPGAFPGVVILTPGRNEAEHLPTVLPELCEQDYPEFRVVFVDDASDDATPEIVAAMTARYPQLTAVRNTQEPPPGWMGKCWAIHHGYEAWRAEASPAGSAEPSWLCFTDADIHWHPRLLRTAMEHALEHDADLVGVTPTLRFGGPAEAIVQLQLVLALGLLFPFEKAMDPDSPIALTGGAFILVRRSYYDRLGGHEAVKGEMVEDLKLGAAVKALGAKHRVAVAGDLQWCRMYHGPADMWEGLTKNAYAGLDHRWWKALPLCAAVALLNVGPPLYLLAALVVMACWFSAAWLGVALLAAAALLLQARALNAARKLMRLPWPYAWTLPLGSAAYLVITFVSILHYYTKGNAWKGRRYAASPL